MCFFLPSVTTQMHPIAAGSLILRLETTDRASFSLGHDTRTKSSSANKINTYMHVHVRLKYVHVYIHIHTIYIYTQVY